VNATDELRRLLDKRGVKWDYGISGSRSTEFMVNGRYLCFDEYRHGILCTTILTPEQVMDVTMGRETCHDVSEPPKDCAFWPSPHFKCSECGATHVSMEYVYYCPNCGRKVSE
jgi:hypothetical protein